MDVAKDYFIESTYLLSNRFPYDKAIKAIQDKVNIVRALVLHENKILRVLIIITLHIFTLFLMPIIVAGALRRSTRSELRIMLFGFVCIAMLVWIKKRYRF